MSLKSLFVNRLMMLIFTCLVSCSFLEKTDADKYDDVYSKIAFTKKYDDLIKVNRESWFDLNKVYGSYSLLGRAIYENNLEVVNVLISKPVSAKIFTSVNKKNESALDMAVNLERIKIIKKMIEFGIVPVVSDEKYKQIKNNELKLLLISNSDYSKKLVEEEMSKFKADCSLDDKADINVIISEDFNLDAKDDYLQIRSCLIKDLSLSKSQLEIMLSGKTKPIILIPSRGRFNSMVPPSYHDVRGMVGGSVRDFTPQVMVKKLHRAKGSIVKMSTPMHVDTWDDYHWFISNDEMKLLYHYAAVDSSGLAPKFKKEGVVIDPAYFQVIVNNLSIKPSELIDKSVCTNDNDVAMLRYELDEIKATYINPKTVCGKRHRY